MIVSYLDWRVSIRVAERMERAGRSVEFRSQRDPVVAEAIRLLSSVNSQEELFAAAARVKAATEKAAATSTGG